MKLTARVLAATSVAGLGAGAAAAGPAVVADIAPIHSIVANVMQGVAEPTLLLPPGATPHGYALRPSEARSLEDADIVFWIGPVLSPWLAGPLDNIAGDARREALMDAGGIRLLPLREGGPFEAHRHDRGDDHVGAGHGEADHAALDDHAHGPAHDHDHDHDQDDHVGRIHEHEHGGADGHLWLDPINAIVIAEAAADVLAVEDPDNAEAYRANAGAFRQEMEALVEEIAADLSELENRSFIVFHDAYQYFEDRFGLPAAGSIALHDADTPSPARMEQIQERIRDAGVACVFAEPQFEPRLAATAIEGSEARTGVLDPIGFELEPGADLYPALIRKLAADLRTCLEAT